MLKLYDYVNERDGSVILGPIEAPPLGMGVSHGSF